MLNEYFAIAQKAGTPTSPHLEYVYQTVVNPASQCLRQPWRTCLDPHFSGIVPCMSEQGFSYLEPSSDGAWQRNRQGFLDCGGCLWWRMFGWTKPKVKDPEVDEVDFVFPFFLSLSWFSSTFLYFSFSLPVFPFSPDICSVVSQRIPEESSRSSNRMQ